MENAEAAISSLCWATIRFSSTVIAGEQADVLEGAGDAGLLRDAEAVHPLEQERPLLGVPERQPADASACRSRSGS